MVEQLKQYILKCYEDRNKVFEELKSSTLTQELTPKSFRANCYTHGIQFTLDFLESLNEPIDFIPDTLKLEREKYNMVLGNTKEFDKLVKEINESKKL